MRRIKKLSTAIALVALSMAIGVASVRASPETPQLGTMTITPLLSSILNNVNTIGDDTFSTVDPSTLSPPPTQHYGPYASSSTDSGSCGPDWANDAFDRHFSIFSQNGAIVVVEQFKSGTFLTPASDSPNPLGPNPSPGACDNGQVYNGGLVNNGVTGSFHGYFIIPIPPTETQISNDPSCVAGSPSTPCTTTGFIDSHFSPACYLGGSGTCPVTTFFFHYSGGLGQGLIANSWIDSSTDRAGEIGDIESTTV